MVSLETKALWMEGTQVVSRDTSIVQGLEITIRGIDMLAAFDTINLHEFLHILESIFNGDEWRLIRVIHICLKVNGIEERLSFLSKTGRKSLRR